VTSGEVPCTPSSDASHTAADRAGGGRCAGAAGVPAEAGAELATVAAATALVSATANRTARVRACGRDLVIGTNPFATVCGAASLRDAGWTVCRV
jgi:hypothetical protein